MPASRTSSPTSSRSSNRRSGANAQNQIIDLLKDDHKRVRKALRDFEKLDLGEDAERCQEIIEQVCADLELHAAIEEELFYPAARAALPEADLIDEAEVEHTTLKRLIADLKILTPSDEKYAATFTVLGEYVKHHVSEEEGEIFPQLAKAKVDWQGLQQRMTRRRQELAGATDDDQDDKAGDEEDEEEQGRSRSRSGRGAGSSAAAGNRDDEE